MVFCAWGGPITWAARRSKVIAMSSTAAECRACVHAVKECAYLSRVYKNDFGYDSLKIAAHKDVTEAMFEKGAKPISLMQDNISCIAISQNPCMRKASKHIALKYHYTRAAVREGAVRLVYCPTKEMVADIFTKALARGPFEYLRSKLMHPLPEVPGS